MTIPSGPEPLCRFNGHTCGACCWGTRIGRGDLRARLSRHTRLFAIHVPPNRPPSRAALLAHELRSRGGLDLFAAPLLFLPLLGDLLRRWLGDRFACAFLGFEDDARRRVGCLLHPTRWGGRDVHRKAAFALLRGMGCGSAEFYCLAARFFAAASWLEHARLARRAVGLDWFGFSRLATSYQPRRT